MGLKMPSVPPRLGAFSYAGSDGDFIAFRTRNALLLAQAIIWLALARITLLVVPFEKSLQRGSEIWHRLEAQHPQRQPHRSARRNPSWRGISAGR